MNRFLAAVAGACALGLPLVGCSKHTDEPDRRDVAFTPSSSTTAPTVPTVPPPSARPSPSATGPFSSYELRAFHTRIPHERCEDAAKHFNQVNGRADFDKNKETLFLLSGCLGMGNQAWDECQKSVTTPEDYKKCSGRYLVPQEDIE